MKAVSLSFVLIILLVCGICSCIEDAKVQVEIQQNTIESRATQGPNEEEARLRNLFSKFVFNFKREYNGMEEYEKRFQIFKENVEIAEKMDRLSQTAHFGVTKFMDMSREEFRRTYLNGHLDTEKIKSQLPKWDDHHQSMSINHNNNNNNNNDEDIPYNFNWRDHGAVTWIKDQGQCGSCWAFSTTGNIEGQWFLHGNKLTSLSEQQLVDCDHFCDPDDPTSCDQGCNGGIMTNAYRWIINNTFIATESSYPYYAATGHTCKTKGVEFGAKIDSFVMLPEDEEQLKAILYKQGPLSVALNADDLQFYKWGVLEPGFCKGREINHGVLITGYGSVKSWFSEKRAWWWIVKNSWDSNWGEEGYFRIVLGQGACKINSFVTTSIINNSTRKD